MNSILDLAKWMAPRVGFSEPQAWLYVRRLHEMDRLPKSSGRAIVKPTPDHAAVLLIAMAASPQANWRTDKLPTMRTTEANFVLEAFGFGFPAGTRDGGPVEARFVNVLAAILADPAQAATVESVTFERPSWVSEIRYSDGTVRRHENQRPIEEAVGANASRVSSVARIDGELLREIAAKFV